MNSNEMNTAPMSDVVALVKDMQTREPEIQAELSRGVADRRLYSRDCRMVDSIARRHLRNPQGLLHELRSKQNRELCAHAAGCPYCLVRVLHTLGMTDALGYGEVLDQIRKVSAAARAPASAEAAARETGAVLPGSWSGESLADVLAGVAQGDREAEHRLQGMIAARFSDHVARCLEVLGRPRRDTISRALARPYYELVLHIRGERLAGLSLLAFQRSFLKILVRHMGAAAPVLGPVKERDGDDGQPACHELRSVLSCESPSLAPAERRHLAGCPACWRWWMHEVGQRTGLTLEQTTARDRGVVSGLREAVQRLRGQAAEVLRELVGSTMKAAAPAGRSGAARLGVKFLGALPELVPTGGAACAPGRRAVRVRGAEVELQAIAAEQSTDGRYCLVLRCEEQPGLLAGKGALLSCEGIPVGFGEFVAVEQSMMTTVRLAPRSGSVKPRHLDPVALLDAFTIAIIDAPAGAAAGGDHA